MTHFPVRRMSKGCSKRGGSSHPSRTHLLYMGDILYALKNKAKKEEEQFLPSQQSVGAGRNAHLSFRCEQRCQSSVGHLAFLPDMGVALGNGQASRNTPLRTPKQVATLQFKSREG